MASPNNVQLGPGRLFVADAGTTEPVSASATLPSGTFFEVGYTEDGSTFSYEISSEAIEVEEEIDPIFYRTTSRVGTLAVAMAETTRRNLALAINKGAGVPNDASSLEPPAANAEQRIMIVFDSVEGARWIFRQCLQAGTMEIARKKAPDKSTIAVEFRLEKPEGVESWKVFPNSDGLI